MGVGAAPSRPYQPSFAALSPTSSSSVTSLSLSLLEAVAERLAAPLSCDSSAQPAASHPARKPNPSEPPEPLFHLETARRHSSLSFPLLCMDASSTKLPAALLSASPAAALFFSFFSLFLPSCFLLPPCELSSFISSLLTYVWRLRFALDDRIGVWKLRRVRHLVFRELPGGVGVAVDLQGHRI